MKLEAQPNVKCTPEDTIIVEPKDVTLETESFSSTSFEVIKENEETFDAPKEDTILGDILSMAVSPNPSSKLHETIALMTSTPKIPTQDPHVTPPKSKLHQDALIAELSRITGRQRYSPTESIEQEPILTEPNLSLKDFNLEQNVNILREITGLKSEKEFSMKEDHDDDNDDDDDDTTQPSLEFLPGFLEKIKKSDQNIAAGLKDEIIEKETIQKKELNEIKDDLSPVTKSNIYYESSLEPEIEVSIDQPPPPSETGARPKIRKSEPSQPKGMMAEIKQELEEKISTVKEKKPEFFEGQQNISPSGKVSYYE